jgi:hypothetical protein
VCERFAERVPRGLAVRAAAAQAYVMPDRKTVYTTDDGANVGFFQFRADRPGDLSSGSLWAAKMTQLTNTNGGSFKMGETWEPSRDLRDRTAQTLVIMGA